MQVPKVGSILSFNAYRWAFLPLTIHFQEHQLMPVGLLFRRLQYRKKKSKGVDYNAEIPFERKAPAGFYDVSAEEGPAEDPNFVNVNLDELEGKRRVDMEALLRKQDEERQRRKEQQDMPGVVMQINK